MVAAMYLLSWRQSSSDVVQARHCELPLTSCTITIIRFLSEYSSEYFLNLLLSQRSAHAGCMKTVQ